MGRKHVDRRPLTKTAVILQPGYLPWLGFFEQYYRCDVFVIYDDVQYDKDGWRNRNRIKTVTGWQWLTVPVLTSGQNKPLVKDTRINNKTNWPKKNLASIQQNYAKAPYFQDYIDAIQQTYTRKWDFLIDLDMHFIRLLAGWLGLEREVRFASELGGLDAGSTARLVHICQAVGADIFYEGAAGKNYLDEAQFEQHGIRLEYQQYDHPEYTQLHGEFVAYMSVLDLLLNHGPESLTILTHKDTLEMTTS